MLFFKQKEQKETVRELKAFVSGQVIPVEKVDDPVFSTKMLGDGVAILPMGEGPAGQTITAPADGEIAMVADTGHAVGMKLANGAELLIHIGRDTIALEGKGFHVLVRQGQQVKAGELLAEFDRALIEEKGYATDCIMLIANRDAFPDLRFMSGMEAVQNETVIGEFA